MRLSYHYMLMVNHVILQKKLFLSLKDTGLTLGQPRFWIFSGKKTGQPRKKSLQPVISNRHLLQQSSTVWKKRIDPEEKHERNRRSWHIFLTDRGKEMVEAIDKGFEELEVQAFSGISGRNGKIF